MSYCPRCGGKCGPTLVECTCPPRVKLPLRYEVVASGVYEEEDDGAWMLASHVIAALKDARVDFE